MHATRQVGGRQVPLFLYGTAWKEEATADLVRQALQAGFRGVDTANQRKHYHEAGVGEALREAFAEGWLTRDEVFLQTKFTYVAGQDHRLPYDPDARPAEQVRQSFASSLEHLGVERLDSYVLHGPSTSVGLATEDHEVWAAMQELQVAGKVDLLGVSNVRLGQLEELCARAAAPPAFVQNRCYASRGWDRGVRAFCREQGIVYQGFSLLTANRRELALPAFRELVARTGWTPAQLVFAFALTVGMLPLTGTSDPQHMREDLAACAWTLPPEDVALVETLGD